MNCWGDKAYQLPQNLLKILKGKVCLNVVIVLNDKSYSSQSFFVVWASYNLLRSDRLPQLMCAGTILMFTLHYDFFYSTNITKPSL